ncbi:DUF5677 domain-containing protein [Haloflavibacter putidus]|uniref:Uncharacterized protein n=1 Tax=Haloflavibacter putidus TaxID=2576776 RepID=A0A507ZBF3_9FLAO|nr:DUF5677 domain-containing protein [Haloflavibacter putidus]TQD34031.1 hypothetical protein FKR84_12485 [Haloflavibacter putidus]
MENKEQLRNEARRLLNCEDFDTCFEVLDIYQNFLFELIMDHPNHNVDSQAESDAKIMLQMIFTKISHLRKNLEGVEYRKDDAFLNRVIDPTIISSLIRNLYETVAIFNLIFIYPDKKEKRTILYNLWVISGLKYRKRFEEAAKLNQSIEKLEAEKKIIEDLKEEIFNTDLFKSLDDKNQKKIITKIRKKDYKIKIDADNVEFLNWQDLTSTLGFTTKMFDNIYNHFSLHTHPTNVAVFQFQGMFGNDKPFLELTYTSLREAIILISIFIADYIKLFPARMEDFERLDLMQQIAINFQNRMARGDNYSINDCLESLE